MKKSGKSHSGMPNCSCTSCTYKYGKGSRIDRLQKKIPQKERQLLEKLARTRAVYDNLRAQLISDSTFSSIIKPDLNPDRKLSKRDLQNEEGRAILELVNLVDRGVDLDPKLSDCCSCCNCSSKSYIHEGHGHGARVRQSKFTRKSKKERNEDTKREKFSNERRRKRGLRFKPKHIRSDPCTCALKFNALLKKQSKSLIKKLQREHSAPDMEVVETRQVVVKRLKRIGNVVKSSYEIINEPIRHVQGGLVEGAKKIKESTRNITESIQIAARKSLEKLKNKNDRLEQITCECPELNFEIENKSKIKESNKRVKEAVFKGARKIIESKDQIKVSLHEGVQKIKESTDNIGESIQIAAKKSLEKIKSAKEKLKQSIKSEVSNVMEMGNDIAAKIKKDSLLKFKDDLKRKEELEEWTCEPECDRETCVPEECFEKLKQRKSSKNKGGSELTKRRKSRNAKNKSSMSVQSEKPAVTIKTGPDRQKSPLRAEKNVGKTETMDIVDRQLRKKDNKESLSKESSTESVTKPVKRKAEPEMRHHPAVRIESSFSFKIEFSKAKQGLSEYDRTNQASPPSHMIKIKQREKKTPKLKIKRHKRGSQVVVKRSSVDTQFSNHTLKRCFCMLKLKSKRHSKKSVKRLNKSIQSFISGNGYSECDMNPSRCDSQMCDSLQCQYYLNHKFKNVGTKASSKNAVTLDKFKQDNEKGVFPLKHPFLPYECESGICNLGYCNPYECLKLTDKRVKRKQLKSSSSHCTCTKRSVSSNTSRSYMNLSTMNDFQSHVPVQRKEVPHSQIFENSKKQANSINNNKGWQAVRIGSTFSFNVEFYKTLTSSGPDITNVKSIRSQSKPKTLMYSKERHHKQKPIKIKKKSTATTINKIEHNTTVGTTLKRCFCTLKLKSKNMKKLKSFKGSKSTFSSFTSGKDLKFPVKQRSKEIGTSTNMKTKSIKFIQSRKYKNISDSRVKSKILPYECEPGICTPRFCNPYECFKFIDRRKKRKIMKNNFNYTREKISISSLISKSLAPTKTHYKRGDEHNNQYVESTTKLTKNIRDMYPHRTGSTFSFNEEFNKTLASQSSPTNNIIVSSELNPVLHFKKRNRKHKQIKNFKSTRTEMKTKERHAQIEKSLKRCFCTLKLYRKEYGKKRSKTQTASTGAETTESEHVVEMSSKSTKINRKHLAHFEYEPNICVPGECDPYVCFERIKRRNVRLKNVGLATNNISTSNTTDMDKAPHRSVRIQSQPIVKKNKTYTKIRDHKRYIAQEKVAASGDSSGVKNRQVFTLGSTFSFDFEFSRSQCQEAPQIVSKKRLGKEGVKKKTMQTPLIHTQMVNKTQSTALSTKPRLKRCFCTLNLVKKQKQQHDPYFAKKATLTPMIYAVNKVITANVFTCYSNIERNSQIMHNNDRHLNPKTTATDAKMTCQTNSCEARKSVISSVSIILSQSNEVSNTVLSCPVQLNLEKSFDNSRNKLNCNIIKEYEINNKKSRLLTSLSKNSVSWSRKSFGLNHCFRRCLCTLNVYTKKKHMINEDNVKINRKLEPYECEPGVCIPGQCNPYECEKLIIERLRRRAAKKSATDRTSQSSSYTKTNISSTASEAIQSYVGRKGTNSQVEYRNKKHTNIDNAQKQAVRIGSSFSFDIEFFKDNSKNETKKIKPTFSSDTRLAKPVAQTGKRYRTSGSKGYKRRYEDQHSQSDSDTSDKGSDASPAMGRCFCTLKLQKQGRLHKQKFTNVNMGLKQIDLITRGQNTAKIKPVKLIRHLEPYECVPGICVPGRCNPYTCQKLIEHRLKLQGRHAGTNTIYSGHSVSVSTKSRQSRHKHHAVNIKPKAVNKKTRHKHENRRIRPYPKYKEITVPNTSRQAVRIGSSFSFNVEFFKDNQGLNKYKESLESIPTNFAKTQFYPNIRKAEMVNHDSQVFIDSKRDKESQIKYYVPTKSTITESFFKRCFCTAKLHAGALLQTKHFKKTFEEKPKLKKDRIKVMIEKSSTADKKINTRLKKLPLYLAPYECLPGICTPGECNPYKCYEIMKRNRIETRSIGSSTNSVKTRTLGSYSTRMLYKNKNTQLKLSKVPKRVGHQTHLKTRHPMDSKRYLQSPHQSGPNRQAVKIGSSFSFNVEFFKQNNSNAANGNTNPSDKKYKENFNSKRLGKQKIKKIKHTGSNGRFVSFASSSTQSAKKESATIGVNTFLKRCFCVLKLKQKQKQKKTPRIKVIKPKPINMNTVGVMAVERKKKHPRKLLPYECEPNVCVPYECNPKVCEKLIKERLKEENRESGTATQRQRQNHYTLNEIKPAYKPPITKKAYISGDHSGQSVKVGSSFKFDIDFMKDKTGFEFSKLPNISNTERNLLYAHEFKRPLKKRHRGLQYHRHFRDEEFQSSNELLKTDSTMARNLPYSNRCFCTLYLRKPRHENMLPFQGKTLTDSTDASTEANIKLKRNKLRKNKNKKGGLATPFPKRSSVIAVTDESSKDNKNVKIKPNRKSKASKPHDTGSNNVDSLKSHAVHIGSNFSFNIEFYKNYITYENLSKTPIEKQIESKNLPTEKQSEKKKSSKKISKSIGRNKVAEVSKIATHSDKTRIPALLKRCFCTLKLHQLKKKRNQLGLDRPPNEKEVNTKKQSFLRSNIPFRYQTRIQKLEPYECEPGICVPEECDPYECEKLLKKRTLNSISTQTKLVSNKLSLHPTEKVKSKSVKIQTKQKSHKEIKAENKSLLQTKQKSNKEIKPENKSLLQTKQKSNKEVKPENKSLIETKHKSNKKTKPENKSLISQWQNGKEIQEIKSPNGLKRAVDKNLNVGTQNDLAHKNIKEANLTEPLKDHSGSSKNHTHNVKDESTQSKNKQILKNPTEQIIKETTKPEKSSVANKLQKCFCTLKLHKKPHQNLKIEKIDNVMRSSVATQNKGFIKKNDLNFEYNLDPFQCEPFTCIPEQCDPKECQKRLKERQQKKLQNNTPQLLKFHKPKSTRRNSRRLRKQKLQSGNANNTQSKIVELPRFSNIAHKTVRIGSNFNVNIEFYKETIPQTIALHADYGNKKTENTVKPKPNISVNNKVLINTGPKTSQKSQGKAIQQEIKPLDTGNNSKKGFFPLGPQKKEILKQNKQVNAYPVLINNTFPQIFDVRRVTTNTAEKSTLKLNQLETPTRFAYLSKKDPDEQSDTLHIQNYNVKKNKRFNIFKNYEHTPENLIFNSNYSIKKKSEGKQKIAKKKQHTDINNTKLCTHCQQNLKTQKKVRFLDTSKSCDYCEICRKDIDKAEIIKAAGDRLLESLQIKRFGEIMASANNTIKKIFDIGESENVCSGDKFREPMFEVEVDSGDYVVLNKDEVVHSLKKIKQKLSKAKGKEVHEKSCNCCICVNKRRMADARHKSKFVKRRYKPGPCTCGSSVCEKSASDMARSYEIMKARGVQKKPCVCGGPVCEKETRLLKLISKNPEKIMCICKQEMEKLRRQKQKVEEIEREKRHKKYKKQDELRRKQRAKKNKTDESYTKKMADKSTDLMLLADSLVDIGKLGFRTGSDISRCLIRSVIDPKRVKQMVKEPKKFKGEVGNSGAASFLRRIKYRLGASNLSRKILKCLLRHPVSRYIIATIARDRNVKLAPLERERERFDFSCSLYMGALRKRRYLWVYDMCPGFYKHFMSIVNVWRQFTEVVLFLIAAVVWSPCILCVELCRALACCLVCSG